jgi:hypothetical protein
MTKKVGILSDIVVLA